MNYYLKHRRLFQGIAGWSMIFGACTSGTKYWWIVFLIITIIIGLIERHIDKQQIRAVKTNDDIIIAGTKKDNVGDKLV